MSIGVEVTYPYLSHVAETKMSAVRTKSMYPLRGQLAR